MESRTARNTGSGEGVNTRATRALRAYGPRAAKPRFSAALRGRGWKEMYLERNITGSGSGRPNRRRGKKKMVENERVKLTATGLNTVAIASLIASVIGPTAADIYGIVVPESPYWGVLALCWRIGCAIFHVAARYVLGGLEP